jgi:WD40 repeat protein
MLLQAARLLGREAFQAEPDETTGGLRRVLEALKETEHGKAGDLSVEAVEVPLDFLDPPAEPGHIGRLGHYEILEVIGRGGMGVVLKAFDEKLHRVVAIKVMAPQLAVSAAARGRFLREARAAAAVRDEHVVTIHAVEETKGLPYLVMELLRGMSLQERIDRGGPLEPSDVLQIGMQALRGLAAAHGQGLIHRDVKPANILLENGVERVKLTDFGLARVVDDASASQHGTIAGTPHYMSPEQAAGEAIDHRTDLFSLGSVLYAMCTGRPPFCADTTIGVFKRVREDVPSPIRDINPAIPEWLVALIAKLHAKDTTQRYQSAVELVNELSQRVADLQLPTSKDAKLEIVAAGESAVGRPQSAARGQRWGLTAAAVLFLAVGLGGLTESTGVTQVVPTVIRFVTGDGTLVVELSDHDTTVTVDTGGDLVIRGAGMHEFRLRAGSYPVRADKNGTSIPLERGEISISRGGRTLVRVTRELASRVRATPTPTKPAPPGPLDALDPRHIPAQERFEFQPKDLVQLLGSHRGRQWNSPTVVAFSPNGKLAASVGYDYHVYLWDAETLQLKRILQGPKRSGWELVFFSDSRRILSGGEDNLVRMWDVETGEEIREFKGHTGPVWGIAVSRDGKRVLTGSHDHSVRIWDGDSGLELDRFDHGARVDCLALSPDDLQALSGGSDGILRLWDLETRQEAHHFQAHANNCRRVRFLSDGRRAITCGHDRTVRLWDLEAKEEIRRLEGHSDEVYGVDVTHDGRRAISTGLDRSIRLWDLDNGSELRRMRSPTPFGFCSVRFSSDGERALSGGHDNSLRLWDLKAGIELHAGRPAPAFINASRMAFSQDGTRLVTCMDNGFSTVWDVGSGRELQVLKMTGYYACAAFSADGRHVLCGDQSGLSLWSVETGQKLRRFEGSVAMWDVAISPDGSTVLTGDHLPDGDGSVRMWSFDSGRELGLIGAHLGAVYAVAWSLESRRVLSAGWDKIVRLWDIDSGSLLHQWRHAADVWTVALSPDGRYAATSDDSGFVVLRDLRASGPRIVPLPKVHTDRVRALSFSPDGRALASAGFDGRLIVWDLEGAKVGQQWNYPGAIIGVSFSPEGRHVATLNSNGTVYVLRLAQADEAG